MAVERARVGGFDRGDAAPSEDLVRQYLEDVGRYSLLTAAEEVSLAQVYEAGQRAAGDL
jgi:sigma-70-like protein